MDPDSEETHQPCHLSNSNFHFPLHLAADGWLLLEGLAGGVRPPAPHNEWPHDGRWGRGGFRSEVCQPGFPLAEANLTTHCHLEMAAHWDFQWMKLLSCTLGGPTTSLCKFWRVYFSPQARATDWPRWYSGQSTDVGEKRPPFKSGVLSVRKEKKSCQR